MSPATCLPPEIVMKKNHLIMPLILLVLLLSVAVAAAQTAVTAVFTLPDAGWTVGDALPLALEVTHPAGYTVLTPEIPVEWGDFRVVAQAPAEVVDNGDGTATTRIAVDARLFSPGTFQTPPLAVSVTDGSGQLLEATAVPLAVTIGSVLVEGDTTLRDIKPQAALPTPGILPWLLGGSLVLASVGGATLWWMRRRRRPAFVDNRLPHEWAADELDRIEELAYPAAGAYKLHYTAVSDTVRIYLERTFDIPLMERTTGEVERDLRAARIDAELTRSVVNFLDDADLVKFSTFTPQPASAAALLANARSIVALSKPAPAVASEDDNARAHAATAFSTSGRTRKMEAGA